MKSNEVINEDAIMYRPYSNAKELFDSCMIHGSRIKLKDTCITNVIAVTEVDGICCPIMLHQYEYDIISPEEMLDRYVWKDGSICGIKIKEELCKQD